MTASRSAKPTFRAATAKDLASIEMWLRDERERTGAGFYCNWNIITDGFETEEMFVVDVDGDPVGFLVNEGAHHIIAEVRPDQRGRGYGQVIAEAMLAQSTERGLSVIEIACAPETSAPFWARMGFTPVPSRQAYGGGIYAYRRIPRPLRLGHGDRVPVAVRFYDEDAHYGGGAPFSTYQGEGEACGDHRVRLPERAVCYAPRVVHTSNCFVEIEVDGRRLFRDKTKREEAAAFGVKRDQGGIPYIETICLPSGA